MAYLEYNKDTFVPYEKPKELGKWEAIGQVIWDGKKKAFLRRTFTSWVAILSFFVVFYGILAGFYAICMQGLFYTLNDKYPRYILDSSLIGSNPGLGFRPISENVETDGALISYNATNEMQWRKWANRMDDFLKPYHAVQNGGHNQVVCDYDRPPADGKVCLVNVKNLGPCSADNAYSYRHSSPCIYLKLNKIYDWRPVFHNVSDLPDKFPEDLKQVMMDTDSRARDKIWVTCRGENPKDKENVGPFKYYPEQGFPGYYYPYKNTPGYLSPLVAVHIERPKLNVLINIECIAWAKNVIYSNTKQVREGSVHFEILID